MGMIQLVTGPHLVIITGRKQVGSLLGKALWNVTEIKVLPCANEAAKKHFSDAQLDEDERYVELVKHFVAVTGIYYSSQYDLTRSYQSQVGQEPDLSRVDSRFFLNKFIAEPFLKAHLMNSASLADHFVAVCIEGFVEIQPTTINNKTVSFGVVSRRATGRVGTRHFSRGIDDYGNVSNFVETEQIVYSGKHVGSFVQIRGSIPVYWRQLANLKYKPPMELYNLGETEKVFKSHFEGLLDRFGMVVAVNLVDRGGWEGILAKQFAAHVEKLGESRLHYVHFDFHQHCRKMQWHKISILMDTIDADLRTQGHFTQSLQDSTVLKKQSGVVRTNCIDCLDRTNVVQSAIGQRLLNEQLHEMGLFNPRETIQDHADLVWFFKNIWADNGDAISQQYAGTGALKSDYTRTGQRTTWGLIQDGVKSMIRYRKSNFEDGYRQDAMDLFHGRYIVRPLGPSPFKVGSILGMQSPISILGSALVLSYLTALFLGKTGLGKYLPRALHIPAVLLPASLFLFAILKNGTLFVRYPQLVPPKVKIVSKSATIQDEPSSTSALLFGRKVHQI